MVYNYYDYEDAYYLGEYDKCKEIGTYLLSTLDDSKSEKLLRDLKTISYSWNLSQDELLEIQEILLEVKKCLLANCLA